MTEYSANDYSLDMGGLQVGSEFDPETGELSFVILFEYPDADGSEGVLLGLERPEVEALYLHLGNLL